MANAWLNQVAQDYGPSAMPYSGVSSVTESTFDLNTTYTFGTSGRAAVLMVFVAPETANLTDFWFKVKSYGGTWASTDGLVNWQIREGFQANRRPGNTVVASGTFSPGGTTGWKKVTGLTAALTAGKVYTLIMYDADGGATNFITLVLRYGAATGTRFPHSQEAGTTAEGFATAYTAVNGCPSSSIKVGNRHFAGQIWDTTSTSTGGTYERGCRFRPKENCTLIGAANGTDVVTINNDIKLYADATAPGGTTILTSTGGGGITGTAPDLPTIVWPQANWKDLLKNTWYRLVVKPAASTTLPRKTTTSGSPDSTLLAIARPMGGDFYWTEESGGAWVDDTNGIPQFGPLLIPNEDATAARGRAWVGG